MQKLKDFIVEDDSIFHKNLEYSIEVANEAGLVVNKDGDFVDWVESLEQAIDYVLKQVEESSK